MTRSGAATLTLAAALLLSACGDDGDSTAAPSASAPSTAAPSSAAPSSGPATTAPQPEPACPETVGAAAPVDGVSADLAVRPVVPGVTTPVGDQVGVLDLTTGTGAVAEPGSAVEVKYAGTFYDTGEEFDSSWSRGDDETLPPFQIGVGQVIPGFDLGVTGMAEGGRRLVTIPSACGYGPQGQGPIPPDTDLVFVIDLVTVQPGG